MTYRSQGFLFEISYSRDGNTIEVSEVVIKPARYLLEVVHSSKFFLV